MSGVVAEHWHGRTKALGKYLAAPPFFAFAFSHFKGLRTVMTSQCIPQMDGLQIHCTRSVSTCNFGVQLLLH